MTAVGAISAFFGGMVSFLSPCVLPLVPGYLSYIAGQASDRSSEDDARRRSRMILSACFVLGFSTIFILLGAGAGALSQALLVYRAEANLAGGLLLILFGIFMTGLVRIPLLDRDARWHGALTGGSPATAYLMGLVFALGWTPCIGPILGAILTMTAASDANGVLLLLAYSAGLGLPFLLSAWFVHGLHARLRGARKTGRWLQIAAGAVMIAMGLVMATDRMTDLAGWLLETFPAFASIG